MTTYAEMLDALRKLEFPDRPVIIGIGGYGGSGKSTLARRIAADLGDVAVVAGDDFTIGRQAERCSDWASIDRQRLLAQVLIPVRNGMPARFQEYDWPNDVLGQWLDVPSSKCLVIEGIGIIHPDLMPSFDVSVWVDCALDIAAERGRLRDRNEYGVDHDSFWRDLWAPNDRDYFERFHPDCLADFVIASSSIAVSGTQ